jgi:hypothetical protein
VFDRLLRAYAIDGVDAAFLKRRRGRSLRPRFDAPEAFVDALAAAPAMASASLGLGVDLRLAGAGVSGCALAHEGLVHLTAFGA